MRPGSVQDVKADPSERLAARAVTLAGDPSISARDLAAILTVLADYRSDVLESTLHWLRHRRPFPDSDARTRAAVGLLLALSQNRDDHPSDP